MVAAEHVANASTVTKKISSGMKLGDVIEVNLTEMPPTLSNSFSASGKSRSR